MYTTSSDWWIVGMYFGGWILLIALLLLASGCAETRVYDNGKLAMVIQGDAWNVCYQAKDCYFHADVLNHSESTKAMGSMATGAIGALGAAAISGGLLH